MDAIVLCGGIASRLGAMVNETPKSLLPIRGRPFIEWQLIALREKGIRRVILATGHLGDRIHARVGSGSQFALEIDYSHEEEQLGTAGALRLAAKEVHTWPVLALNGDSFCPFELELMGATHRRLRADATLWLAPTQPGGRYGAVQVDQEGRITEFAEKSPGRAAWISAGVYLLGPGALDLIEVGKVASVERDVFPVLAARGRLAAVRGPAPVIDIGTPESLANAHSLLETQFGRLEVKRSEQPHAAFISEHLSKTAALQAEVAEFCVNQIVNAAALIATSFASGGKLMLCGNGGSAADCQHMAAEFTNRLSPKVERDALPAIALTTDTSFITAFANDYDFERVFARQVEALGRPGDVLLGISTSGRSQNVLAALRAASARGMPTIFLRGTGGDHESGADCSIVIPSTDTQLIQEAMLPVEHLICELVEREFTG